MQKDRVYKLKESKMQITTSTWLAVKPKIVTHMLRGILHTIGL